MLWGEIIFRFLIRPYDGPICEDAGTVLLCSRRYVHFGGGLTLPLSRIDWVWLQDARPRVKGNNEGSWGRNGCCYC